MQRREGQRSENVGWEDSHVELCGYVCSHDRYPSRTYGTAVASELGLRALHTSRQSWRFWARKLERPWAYADLYCEAYLLLPAAIGDSGSGSTTHHLRGVPAWDRMIGASQGSERR
jgi:hypothetical protein